MWPSACVKMLRRLAQDRFIIGCFIPAAAFVIGGAAWAYGALRSINQPLILHFNSYVGINQVGGLGELLGVATLAMVAVLLNFFLAANAREHDVFLARFISATTIVFAALIFIGFAAIISVN